MTSDFLHILDANCSRITKRSGYCFKNQSTNASTNTNTNTNKQQFRESPEFTLSNVLDDIKQGIIAFLINPKVTIIVYPIIICLSSILTKIVINKISYTEIDFIIYATN